MILESDMAKEHACEMVAREGSSSVSKCSVAVMSAKIFCQIIVFTRQSLHNQFLIHKLCVACWKYDKKIFNYDLNDAFCTRQITI